MKDATTREHASPLALIAAGGEGRRLGSIGPKALVVCGGKTLLAWCLDAFAQSASYGHGAGTVVVAAHASDLPAFEDACAEARAQGLTIRVTEGGPSRSHSVAAALSAGLEATADAATEIVLVHDAARIFTTATLIDGLHNALQDHPQEVAALIAARPATDTIKLVDEFGDVYDTPPREKLWTVQTPQAFRGDALKAALSASDETLAAATDDASLVEANGGRVKIYEWTEPNPKITTAEDLSAAATRLGQSTS
jgi:2-C-methyl-D-erythritol 4-phosphate cytidylyltransferase